MSHYIFHITSLQDWKLQSPSGLYRHESLNAEGFIHTSSDKELLGTANRYFEGQKDLVLLVIEREKVDAKVVDEEVYPDRYFPHIFGPLNVDSVIKTVQLGSNLEGQFTKESFQGLI